MSKIKALHIASFHGNIGDNANHNGFRKKLKETLGCDIVYQEMEIREFYHSWGVRDFNHQSFIDCCNEHDLVIIGGGNFFELKWDYSHTGTTINISEATLDRIRTPIFFHGLGCDIHKGASSEAVEKFDAFLNRLTQSDQYLVSIRNDGSRANLRKLYGERYDLTVHNVADGAFYFIPQQEPLPAVYRNYRTIGINVAADMEEVRFKNQSENHISQTSFFKTFSKVLNEFLESHPTYQLVFFPHIYSDLKAINQVVEEIDDPIRRKRVLVAPCLTGPGAEQAIFSLYGYCDMIMGMRFHTNVCAIAQGVPTIGLNSYVKIRDLYQELGIPERTVDINKNDFEFDLTEQIKVVMANKQELASQYETIREKVHVKSQIFYDHLRVWAEKHHLISSDVVSEHSGGAQ